MPNYVNVPWSGDAEHCLIVTNQRDERAVAAGGPDIPEPALAVAPVLDFDQGGTPTVRTSGDALDLDAESFEDFVNRVTNPRPQTPRIRRLLALME
jgi:hypothetical protein